MKPNWNKLGALGNWVLIILNLIGLLRHWGDK